MDSNDYRSNLIALLFSKNGKARMIGLIAAVPFILSVALPIATNQKLTLAEKVTFLSTGASSFLISVGLAAINPRELKDKNDSDDDNN